MTFCESIKEKAPRSWDKFREWHREISKVETDFPVLHSTYSFEQCDIMIQEGYFNHFLIYSGYFLSHMQMLKDVLMFHVGSVVKENIEYKFSFNVTHVSQVQMLPIINRFYIMEQESLVHTPFSLKDREGSLINITGSDYSLEFPVSDLKTEDQIRKYGDRLGKKISDMIIMDRLGQRGTGGERFKDN